jgi:small RNA 2'-O-methyltransferase
VASVQAPYVRLSFKPEFGRRVNRSAACAVWGFRKGRGTGRNKGEKVTSSLHDQRFTEVLAVLAAHSCGTVLDLGCGKGDFLLRLLDQPHVTLVTGIEPDLPSLTSLRAALAQHVGAARARVLQGSVLDPLGWWHQVAAPDAAVMVEVLEHLDPSHLSRLETALFARIAAPLTIITTPNADFNPLLGVPPHRFRHPGHRFEWGRAKFRGWADSVALRWRLAVQVSDIAGNHPDLGGASQMAVFLRQI